MSSTKLADMLKSKRVIICDGATGTNLMHMGLPNGLSAEHWVLSNSDSIHKLHEEFIESGADILLTCTFGASKTRLEQNHLESEFSKINQKAVEIARNATKGTSTLIAGSMGPLGHMLKPVGLLDESEAEKIYSEQAEVLSGSGVDLIIIETQFDIAEAQAAIKGTKKVCGLPVICSFSFDRGKKTMMGVSPAVFSQTLSETGIFALGINCGKSLEDNLYALMEIHQLSALPIWFKPNAGLPKITSDGLTEYDVTPDLMASHVDKWIENGALFIGGCCGTTPSHLKAIADASHAYYK